MSPLSPEETPAEITAFLEREARRRHDLAHAPAVDALTGGLAFADGPGPDDEGEDDGATAIDDPTLDEALETIARIGRQLRSLN